MLSRFTFAYQKISGRNELLYTVWNAWLCTKCHKGEPQRKCLTFRCAEQNDSTILHFNVQKYERMATFSQEQLPKVLNAAKCGIECFKNNRLVWISQSIIAKAGLSLKPHFMATLFPLSLSQNWIWNIFKQLLICFYATKNECVLMWKRVFMSIFFWAGKIPIFTIHLSSGMMHLSVNDLSAVLRMAIRGFVIG